MDGTPEHPGRTSPTSAGTGFRSSPPLGGAGGGEDAPLPPGEVIADRYRVVSLLGRGGMGEVYRADDLTLGMPVALKFLPPALSTDPVRLDRFRTEVSLARRVSHPNVCRVYDIGRAQTAGGPRDYCTMEFIDGEDLSSLLRRIGRLPREKAADAARQICFGLAAVHEQGLIHRDLKPANIMLDGRGRVRITDFGVAGLADTLRAGAGAGAGTPAYMAPEQLDRGEITPRTDLYALGLVLHELFTGKPAFGSHDGQTLQEIRRTRDGRTGTDPSSLIDDLDPAAARAITRCLAPLPADRPASAMAVAAMLPGGDPLAAVLAAGDTPSPELVAASGEEGVISRRRGWTLLLIFLGMVGWMLVWDERSALHRQVRFLPPSVLEHDARAAIKALGYDHEPSDFTSIIERRINYSLYLAAIDQSPDRNRRLLNPVNDSLTYTFRQSESPLVPTAAFSPVSLTDPPPVPGDIMVVLSGGGTLLDFRAPPPSAIAQSQSTEPTPRAEPDWGAAFTLAGLDMSRFEPDQPRLAAPFDVREPRRAWKGAAAGEPDIPLRVEAAAGESGKIARFAVLMPWRLPKGLSDAPIPATAAPFPAGLESAASRARTELEGIVPIFQALVIASCVVLSIRNLRARRGDRTGAMAVGVFTFLTLFAGWACTAHHPPALRVDYYLTNMAMALLDALIVAGLYIAIEPVLRALWPQRLISWTRLTRGQWRSPLVAHDVLAGLVGGAGLAACVSLPIAISNTLARAPRVHQVGSHEKFRSVLAAAGEFSFSVGVVMIYTLAAALVLCAYRTWVRPRALAVALFVLTYASWQGTSYTLYWSTDTLASYLAYSGVFTWLLYRRGLLSATVAAMTARVALTIPTTLDLRVWYAPSMLLWLGLLLLPAAYGFRFSTRPSAGKAGVPAGVHPR